MEEQDLSKEWEILFKKAEEQYSKYKNLNDISQKWHKVYENINCPKYQIVNGNNFKINDLPKII